MTESKWFEADISGDPKRVTRDTINNHERTGERYVSRFSKISRQVTEVAGTRTLDIDSVYYCQKCWRKYLYVEVKPQEGDYKWKLMRTWAAQDGHGCKAALCVEPRDYTEERYAGLQFWSAEKGISPLRWYSREGIVKILNQLASQHVCW